MMILKCSTETLHVCELFRMSKNKFLMPHHLLVIPQEQLRKLVQIFNIMKLTTNQLDTHPKKNYCPKIVKAEYLLSVIPVTDNIKISNWCIGRKNGKNERKIRITKLVIRL